MADLLLLAVTHRKMVNSVKLKIVHWEVSLPSPPFSQSLMVIALRGFVYKQWIFVSG